MKIILTLILVIVLSSCDNSSGSGNAKNTDTIGQQGEFAKIPTNQLYRSNVCASPGAGSVRYYFTKLSSNSATSEYDVFEQTGCENNTSNQLSFTIKKTVSVNNEISNSVDNTFKQVSLVATKFEAMPLSQQYADIWNTANYCGFSDWSPSVYKDISNCDQQTQIGSVGFLTFKFINNQILLFDGNYYE